MSLELISATVIGIATLLLMWQQNRILQRQNEIFAQQEGADTQSVKKSATLGKYWPMVAMAGIMSLTWAAVGFDYYDRHYSFGYDPARAWDDNKPLERVYSQVFRNQTVVLDGKHFIDPAFDNVTFFYGGSGPVQIDNPRYAHHGPNDVFLLESNNKVVAETITLATLLAQQSGCNSGSVNKGPINPNLPPDAK